MPWLRLDDGFAQHPKLAGWTPEERWDWVVLLLWCARYKTGGRIPTDPSLLPVLSSAVSKVKRGNQHKRAATYEQACLHLLSRAVSSGLAEDLAESELQVHDWEEYNGPNASNRLRQARFREKRNAQRNDGGNGEVTAEVTEGVTPDVTVLPRARDPQPQEPLGVKPSGGSKGSRPREPHATPQRAASRARCPDCEVGGGLHAADCPRAPKP